MAALSSTYGVAVTFSVDGAALISVEQIEGVFDFVDVLLGDACLGVGRGVEFF